MLVTLIVVLIAAIAVLGFLYFKKPFKTGDTETSDKIVSEEMTEELIATIEETVNWKNDKSNGFKCCHGNR